VNHRAYKLLDGLASRPISPDIDPPWLSWFRVLDERAQARSKTLARVAHHGVTCGTHDKGGWSECFGNTALLQLLRALCWTCVILMLKKFLGCGRVVAL
jgi:hypothetical protein